MMCILLIAERASVEATEGFLIVRPAMGTIEFDPPANFARHSGKPSCVVASPGVGPPALLALRPLKEGDEITWDRGRKGAGA